jgi:hypothetical protein
VSLLAPYFENNASWHMWLGTDQALHARVTVLEPVMRSGHYTVKGRGAILADRVTGGAFIGGDFSDSGPNPIQFTSASSGVAVLGAETLPNVPTYNPGGGQSIGDYPGLVQHTDPTTGELHLAGRFITQLGGGSAGLSAAKSMMGTKAWGGGKIDASSALVFDVSVPATLVGDQVLVTSTPPWSDGLTVSGIVVAPGSVHVTIANATRAAISVPSTTLKVVGLRLLGG